MTEPLADEKWYVDPCNNPDCWCACITTKPGSDALEDAVICSGCVSREHAARIVEAVNEHASLRAEVARLTRERNALVTDKARLDWIENTGAKVFWTHGPDKRETWRVETVTDSNSRPTLREAIDLAIAMGRETDEDGATASAI